MLLAKIFLKQDNEEFDLPVLPEEIEIAEKSNNSSQTLQNLGEVTLINGTKLATLKLSGLFPKRTDPYVSSNSLKKPNEYIAMLKKWRDSKKPLTIAISETAFPIEWKCTIESLVYKEKAGEVGDIYYSIDLKEYRYFNVKKAEIIGEDKSKVVVENTRVSEKETPETYKIKKGDTLYAIAKKFYGNGNKWRELYKKNKSIIKNPNLIYPGQVINL